MKRYHGGPLNHGHDRENKLFWMNPVIIFKSGRSVIAFIKPTGRLHEYKALYIRITGNQHEYKTFYIDPAEN